MGIQWGHPVGKVGISSSWKRGHSLGKKRDTQVEERGIQVKQRRASK